MARKKVAPKPLFDLKHDFVASLDNVCHEATNLFQTAQMVIDHGNLPEPVKALLDERVKAMRAALFSDD